MIQFLFGVSVSCEANTNDKGLNTDHIPVVTRLDVALGKTPEMKTNNYRNVGEIPGIPKGQATRILNPKQDQ